MRIAVAEDSILFREGLVRLLEAERFEIVAQISDASDVLRAVVIHEPDLLIADVRMPPTHTDDGLVAAITVREQCPGTAVLVLSHHVEAAQAMRLLADDPAGVGYLLKDRVTDLDDFCAAVRNVGSGGSVIDPGVVRVLLDRQRSRDRLDVLTARERDVLALMAEGRTNGAISDTLAVGRRTVEAHVGSIFVKLGLFPAPEDHRRVLAVLAHLRST